MSRTRARAGKARFDHNRDVRGWDPVVDTKTCNCYVMQAARMTCWHCPAHGDRADAPKDFPMNCSILVPTKEAVRMASTESLKVQQDQSLKKDAGKPPMELIPGRALQRVLSELSDVELPVARQWQDLFFHLGNFSDGMDTGACSNTCIDLPICAANAIQLLGNDYTALVRLAEVLAFGAEKYSRDGWRAGMAWRRLIGAMWRHALKARFGEQLDEETGLPHLAHFLCDALFLIEYAMTKNGTDDRFKRALCAHGTDKNLCEHKACLQARTGACEHGDQRDACQQCGTAQ